MYGKVVALAIVGLLTCGASGAVVSFDLSVEYSGASSPVGDPPWLRAVFDDDGSEGSVTLTLETVNLSMEKPYEFVGVWMFNLDPDLEPADLVFTLQLPKTGKFEDPDISHAGKDLYKADGDGYFDIEFAFFQGDGTPKRFTQGDVAVYVITGIATLTADSFDFISEPGGGQGEYETAAHVQNIAGGGGWITVPEPATLSLLGLAGLALMRRRHAH